jgi:hypothetical protein
LTNVLPRRRTSLTSSASNDAHEDEGSSVDDSRAWIPPEFRVLQEGFSPFKCYTRARDGEGERERVRLQLSVPMWVLALAEDLVHSRDWPDFRSLNDFNRDAWVQRLHFCMENSEHFQEGAVNLAAYMERERLANELQRDRDIVDGWEESFMRHREDVEALAILVATAKEQVKVLRMHWKMKLVDIIERYDRGL